jgi:hypothetical protein
MADTLGFGVVQPIHPFSYEDILENLPERERKKFPEESSELMHHVAARINSIESI